MNERQAVFTQISLFSVLLGGRYGGVCSVADVKKYGNMAIATMDRLDGEMQMIDGVVYQACADGRLLLPKDEETIPFGTIAMFAPERELKLEAYPSYEDFEERMKTECTGLNLPLAVHIKGDFQRMKVRAVGRQEKDGVGLAEAARNEAVFELNDTTGDLVGFRLPGYVQGVNAPGWHLHFVDEARKHGGHVVNFTLRQGVMRICRAREFRILLPDVLEELDLNRDWSEDLHKAEGER
ncbi:MAG: acetolactate decarboxylase [Victivallales bacterium]|nr:acetolactate decarboxylase [Victivallales bacterium]